MSFMSMKESAEYKFLWLPCVLLFLETVWGLDLHNCGQLGSPCIFCHRIGQLGSPCIFCHRISFTRTVQNVTGSHRGLKTHPKFPCSADMLVDCLWIVITFLNLTSILMILMSHFTAHKNVSNEMCKSLLVDWSCYWVCWLLVNVFEQQLVEQTSTSCLHL